MSSFKSKLVIFAIQNRHLFKGRLNREVITPQTSTLRLREENEKGAQKFSKMPADIHVSPVCIPGLPDGLSAEWIYPAGGPEQPGAADRAIFYTHGGGYVSGNCIDHRMHVARFVQATGVGALLYDYRLAPEHPFPAAMEDTLTAYRWLLEQGIAPARIVIVGESAGGGLCLASLLAIRDERLPLPAAGVALSPWTDLACTGDSYRTNAMRDISTLGSWDVWGGYYVGPNDPRNPWISPLYGDLHGLPPILIQVGDHEILLDDSVRFAAKAKAAGVDICLRVWEDMVHCFPLLAPMFPEATRAWEETMAYIKQKLV
ncbi:esterase/lipase [Longilinea arvoryzae]|uniref:Esterase/lipase n=1 Tax=Longilinea arvoryzae TaxID=360412 RepID=A0A0S7BE87_9CHLR|nr:alpha/beta hydrolase [Longilinea arvoryzae]GAP12710.1 esterase/lipase [Longilinea arvoryzae]